MTRKNISKYIDEVITKIWIQDIKEDYKNKFLLMEDSLKNAFYHHLRKELDDGFLLNNNLRFFSTDLVNFDCGDNEMNKISLPTEGKYSIIKVKNP